MSSFAPSAGKVARIVPRLGSNHDGEIVAAAKAIERTLKAAGLDWHDAARAFDNVSMAPSGSTHHGSQGNSVRLSSPLKPDRARHIAELVFARQRRAP